MGFYVNPPYMSKETWLDAYPVVDPQATGFIYGDELLVCLVDNGPFTAAAVAINKTEYDCFMRPEVLDIHAQCMRFMAQQYAKRLVCGVALAITGVAVTLSTFDRYSQEG